MLTLGAPNASLATEFTAVTAVRELADGRALVLDAGDRRLWVADWTKRSARPIGRQGQGPGEYERPRYLFPVGGDSTILTDPMLGRWLLLDGDSIVTTVAADAPAIRAGARQPLGADGAGRVVFTRSLAQPSDAALPARFDSLYLVRVHRATGAADTLATLAARPARINVDGPANRPRQIEIMMNPLSVGDQIAVFPNGWIAIARVAPYAVDWVAPDGRLVRGALLPFERHAVTEREKRAVLDREALANGREPREPEGVRDWPATMPPFLTGALLAANDGRAWIRRTPRAGEARTVYDLVSRNGALAARLALAANEHVVGFGRGAVYVIRTDDDGIQRLSRHELPRL